jgi:hypothetical protein
MPPRTVQKKQGKGEGRTKSAKGRTKGYIESEAADESPALEPGAGRPSAQKGMCLLFHSMICSTITNIDAGGKKTTAIDQSPGMSQSQIYMTRHSKVTKSIYEPQLRTKRREKNRQIEGTKEKGERMTTERPKTRRKTRAKTTEKSAEPPL